MAKTRQATRAGRRTLAIQSSAAEAQDLSALTPAQLIEGPLIDLYGNGAEEHSALASELIRRLTPREAAMDDTTTEGLRALDAHAAGARADVAAAEARCAPTPVLAPDDRQATPGRPRLTWTGAQALASEIAETYDLITSVNREWQQFGRNLGTFHKATLNVQGRTFTADGLAVEAVARRFGAKVRNGGIEGGSPAFDAEIEIIEASL